MPGRQQFLVIREDGQEAAGKSLDLVLGWFDDLTAKVTAAIESRLWRMLMRRLCLALALASLPAVIAGPEYGGQRSSESRSLLGVRDGLRSAAVAGRHADHLHARVDRQGQRQARVVAVDHERGRQQEPLPRSRQTRAGRRTATASFTPRRAIRKARRSSSATWTRKASTSQVTHLTESPANVTWSPDGQSIAFAMKVEKKTSWSIKMPERPDGAKWIETPRIVERLDYRRMDRASTTMAIVTCSRCRRPAARRGS